MKGEVSRRHSLKIRMVVGLLLIAVVPLAVSAVLVGQIATVAQNFSAHRVERMIPLLERAQSRYHDLVQTKRALFQITVRLFAVRPALIAAARTPAELPRFLPGLLPELQQIEELVRIEFVSAEGSVLASSAVLATYDETRFREIPSREQIADTGITLRMSFLAAEGLLSEHAAIGEELATASKVDAVGGSLPGSYRLAFLIMVGGVVLVVTTVGLILAARISRRIEGLVAGTRRIAAGDLSVRVEHAGGDELAQLARAFNQMVQHLGDDRDKILYLQRIGAWQEVARRLAHEIKNPLTPIQLAVQQTVSSYRGDDEKLKKQLRDTEEIVREEIANLRRLVDAFTVLGRLPRVEPKPLDLAEVISDLKKEPAIADLLDLSAPLGSARVRADKLLLRRLLTNLIENGRDAGVANGKPGRVAVSWEADNGAGQVRIVIDDEGAGVARDHRQKIFEPHFTTKEAGSGLGLAIAKKIAIDHGGTLALADERAPTGGARFVLSLPLGGADDE